MASTWRAISISATRIRRSFYMTGRPDMMARVGNLSGTEALLCKPFAAGQMLAALRTLLRKHA